MKQPPRRTVDLWRVVGPGLVVAATGVGAGDLVAAGAAGTRFGLAVLWTAVFGTVLKFVLAEGVARWQLATGTTVLEGWVVRFGRSVQIYFLAYLVLWTLIVAAALMSACGLAAHALIPAVSVKSWAVLHSVVAFGFVWFESYRIFETAMKIAVGLMFVAIVGTAVINPPPLGAAARGLLVPGVPAGSVGYLLGVIGGVGGTLTLLSYNYWIQEKGWSGPAWMRSARFDLGVGYGLTGVFGVALIALAGGVLHPKGLTIEGNTGILTLAGVLGERFGRAGELVFLLGFWGAVATSILGVWQGVPYLFADFVTLMRGERRAKPAQPVPAVTPLSRTRLYRGYLLAMTVLPIPLLFVDRPVWLVVTYAAIGALFMPFLAVTLLIMNNDRSRLAALRNGWVSNALLVLSLVLFGYLAAVQIARHLG